MMWRDVSLVKGEGEEDEAENKENEDDGEEAEKTQVGYEKMMLIYTY